MQIYVSKHKINLTKFRWAEVKKGREGEAKSLHDKGKI